MQTGGVIFRRLTQIKSKTNLSIPLDAFIISHHRTSVHYGFPIAGYQNH